MLGRVGQLLSQPFRRPPELKITIRKEQFNTRNKVLIMLKVVESNSRKLCQGLVLTQ